MFRKTLLFIAVFAVATPASAETLDQLVPADRQRQLGLDQLSAQQRADVARLLQDVYQLGAREGQKGMISPNLVGPGAVPALSSIESKVDGSFEGWQGDTIVELVNGEVWKQAEYYYQYHYAYMPKALVYRDGEGYKMRVKGIKRGVRVVRVR